MFTDDDISFFTQSPYLTPLERQHPRLCRIWQACELSIYVEYRLGKILNPRTMTETDIQQLQQQALTEHEHLSDPSQPNYSTPFWISDNDKTVGTIKLGALPSGARPTLYIWSLYLFPEYRRQGIARRLLNNLYELAIAHNFLSLRVKTEWTYQAAVQFYLDIGFWLTAWKHNLSFEQYYRLFNYRFEMQNDIAHFFVNPPDSDEYQLCYSAYRNDDYLVFEEHSLAKTLEKEKLIIAHDAICTFSLYLALNGFPLIRSQEEWEERVCYSDGGMPEGLAYKIEIWEAYERKHGFLVNTPKMPRLQYREWDEIMDE